MIWVRGDLATGRGHGRGAATCAASTPTRRVRGAEPGPRPDDDPGRARDGRVEHRQGQRRRRLGGGVPPAPARWSPARTPATCGPTRPWSTSTAAGPAAATTTTGTTRSTPAAAAAAPTPRSRATTTATAPTPWGPWSATTASAIRSAWRPAPGGSAAGTWTRESAPRRPTPSATSGSSPRPRSRAPTPIRPWRRT